MWTDVPRAGDGKTGAHVQVMSSIPSAVACWKSSFLGSQDQTVQRPCVLRL